MTESAHSIYTALRGTLYLHYNTYTQDQANFARAYIFVFKDK